MVDPEDSYRRLASGDAGAVRQRVEPLAAAVSSFDDAGDGVFQATDTPVWTGSGATSFHLRASRIMVGLRTGWMVVHGVKGGVQTVAGAYSSALDDADAVIARWRNRPAPMIAIVEDLLARIVDVQLRAIASGYDKDLAAVAAVLDGKDVDLGELDDDTREWVEKGLDKTQDWLDDTGSSQGPLIPNTKATGDDRGLTPQGLAYDPGSGLYLQTYYAEDGQAVVSVLDPVTGKELNEVVLGDGSGGSDPRIGHAGGVTVDGDDVHVSSGGTIYTYPLSALRDGSSGGVVEPSGADKGVAGDASYCTMHDGKLYVGDYNDNVMYVYERNAAGTWVPPTSGPTSYSTPAKTQGVVVRDHEIIYSTSPSRMSDSTVVVRDHDGKTLGEYDGFPNMSEGIVEVNGQLVVTYESGAEQYQHASTGKIGWLWGVPDDDSLWAGTHLTSTPLSELGLSGELEAEPDSLNDAAAQLREPAHVLTRLSGTLDAVHLPAHLLGDLPSAGALSSTVERLVSAAADSARTGGDGVERLADALEVAGRNYRATDDHAGHVLGRLGPR